MTSETSTSKEEVTESLHSIAAHEEESVVPVDSKVLGKVLESEARQRAIEADDGTTEVEIKSRSALVEAEKTDAADMEHNDTESVDLTPKEERGIVDEFDSNDKGRRRDKVEDENMFKSMSGTDPSNEASMVGNMEHKASTTTNTEERLSNREIDKSTTLALEYTPRDGMVVSSASKDEQKMVNLPVTSSAADAGIDRDLPAPPTPSKAAEKKSIFSDKVEMAEVAKAFGADLKLSGSSRDSTGAVLQPPTSANSKVDTPKTPRSGGLKIGKGPPPTTQASEEKPFDFNRFLDQMRHKSAGPVGEYVRSFIKGFTKKPYRVSDQTKLIFDFLDFISLRMRECEVWSKLSIIEFENATEAMEKLLMNRLYNFTFSPAVRREGKWSVQTDDLERDRVLKQRIRLFGWIKEEHLDVPTGSHSKGFVDFAIEELLKINHYKAPRDKVICILNCCKVIFGLIRHLSSEENADTFIPILIFVVLRSNPEHLISNVEYISRFRNPEKLSSESGYYLSSLMGAIAFIETMDCTSLSNITQEEFEANVENAVESMSAQPDSVHNSPAKMNQTDYEGEKSSGGQSSNLLMAPGPSTNGEESARSLPMSAGAAALAEDTKAFFQRTGEAARAGIGASIGKPMGALGRLFQESLVEGPRTPGGTSPLPVSGRATPETPPVTGGSSAPSTARSRMWGLFGVDGDEAQKQQQQSNSFPRSISTSSSLNFGSWGRNMQQEEEEPQTPLTEELRQGRFANLLDRDQQTPQVTTSLESQLAGHAAPKVQRHQQRRIPQRTDSIDPYSINDEEANLASGVRTPDGDGSDVEESMSPSQTTVAGRPRLSNLGGFLPSFLSEQSITSAPSSQLEQPFSPHRQRQRSQQHDRQSSNGEPLLDNEEAAIATAQIEQAHLAAGVETLKSIFPDVDPSVSRLVLEDCQGDLRRTIDKLLEM